MVSVIHYSLNAASLQWLLVWEQRAERIFQGHGRRVKSLQLPEASLRVNKQ